MSELLAPVPSAADYSVSAELWRQLEEEIQRVVSRIEAGDDLMPDDVKNVQKLKKEVDGYVTDFNKAMRDAQSSYRSMVDRRLIELRFNIIEQFVLKKRQEQSAIQDERIANKMAGLKTISDGLLERTVKLKDVPMAKELLPAFTARFPKVQSGAKNNDILDWSPYFAVMTRTVNILDAFFRDPKYEDAALLPISSFTIRELLAFVKDGKEEHLANVPVMFEKDKPIIRIEKMRQAVTSKEEGMNRIRKILEDISDMDGISEAAQKVRTEQAWEEISLIVRLVNN